MCAKNFINRIKKHIDLGEFEAAEELVKEYKKQFIINAEIYSIIGIIAINKGNLKKAKNVFEKGLKGFPNDFDLNFNLAFVYENLSKLEKAFDFYYRAKELTNKEDNLREIGNSIDRIIKIDKSIITSRKKRIVFFVKKGMDSFLDDIIEGLSNYYITKKIIVTNYEQIDLGMKRADIVWFEWCDELIIYGSQLELAKNKKIICRLHSYEAFTNYINQVFWHNVNKVIFVAEHIRDYVVNKISTLSLNDTIIISNGINLDEFSYTERNPGFNIAFVGSINFKKGPMLLLHTFKLLYDYDNRYKLYLAGRFGGIRYKLYFYHMIMELGLEDNVFLEGWQDNIDDWLENKN